MLKLIQLTPKFPPDISGVGDYAALLGQEFHDIGLPVRTLVARPDGPRSMGGTTVLDRVDGDGLAAALGEADCVLLHFSGYGYDRRGLCRWLVEGLTRWKAAGRHRRIVTMFHEVYATGPVWRSSFWTTRPQRRIAHDLARLSDAAFVSSQGGFDQLKSLCNDLPIEIMEVFSNVGELDKPLLANKRSPTAVVFGGVGRRSQVYRTLKTAGHPAVEALDRYGVHRLIDIGPAADVPSNIFSLKVEALGPLPPHRVSSVLADAKIGLVDYKRSKITKSGIAAAYFAHGLFVVNTGKEGFYDSRLQEGIHLADLKRIFDKDYEIETVATKGWQWYQAHRINAVAEKLSAAINAEGIKPKHD